MTDQRYTLAGRTPQNSITKSYWQRVEDLADQMRDADDEDGGMHVVGVQMLVGYEEGQFTADDLFRKVTT